MRLSWCQQCAGHSGDSAAVIAAWPACDVAGHPGSGGSGAAARRQPGTLSACMHCRQVRKKPGAVYQSLVAMCVIEHVPAHLAMMPYALKALGYFLGWPGARFPSDCILTCKVTAVLLTKATSKIHHRAPVLPPVERHVTDSMLQGHPKPAQVC